MIQISRTEQQVLRNLKNVMAAEGTDSLVEEQFRDVVRNVQVDLVDKGLVSFDEEKMAWVITKEQLQIIDDDPEVEQAWEDFRAVQGDGSMTKLYDRNRKAEAATKHLEEVLFKKGRLTHMVNSDGTHIWVTEDKIQYWKDRKFKEACPAAVPAGL